MLLPLAMLLQAAVPQAPPPPTPTPPASQAQEMADLFSSMCIETAGGSVRAHGLDNAPGVVRPMTPDEMARVMPNTVVTEGWVVKSPHDAWAALWFAPVKRTCGLAVRAADPKSMQAALGLHLKAFYGSLGFPITQRADETAVERGVTVHRASWIIMAGTHQLAVIASFGDKPVGAYQHLMTFTVLH